MMSLKGRESANIVALTKAPTECSVGEKSKIHMCIFENININ